VLKQTSNVKKVKMYDKILIGRLFTINSSVYDATMDR
jgi:hypothetical protein